MPLAASPIDPTHLIDSFGTVGLALILFAECGLLVGFFLPGDTLLFSAGLLVAVHQIHLSFALLLVVLPLAAIAGNLVGYGIGRRAGPAVFNRPNSRIFRPEYVTRSERFYDRFGRVAVLLARFVPVVRTVATVLAGVGRMRFSVYTIYSVIGAVLWADGVLLLGYGLGHVPFVERHQDRVTSLVDPIIIAVVLIGLVPVLVHWIRGRKRSPQL